MDKDQHKNQHMVQYIIQLTSKLAKTYKQLNEMSVQFLKALQPQQQNEKPNKNRNKGKQKLDDLNSNLLNGDNQQVNGMMSRKKIKPNNNIEQAQEDIYSQLVVQKASYQKGGNKVLQKHQNQKYAQIQHQRPVEQPGKKKSKPVSHKPKAPTSSFLLFFKQQQHPIAKSYPEYGVVQLTKVAAKCWNQLQLQQKQPYQKLFQTQRQKYQQLMQNYRKEFPQEVKLKQLEKKQNKKNKARERRQKYTRQDNVKQKQKYKQKQMQKQTQKQTQKQKQKQKYKQKYKHISTISNNDPSLSYNQLTPMGNVKLQEQGPQQQLKQNTIRYQDNYNQIKNQEDVQQDQLGSLDEDNSEQENSLGEDI